MRETWEQAVASKQITKESRRPESVFEWVIAAASLGAVLHGITWTSERLIRRRESRRQGSRDDDGGANR